MNKIMGNEAAGSGVNKKKIGSRALTKLLALMLVASMLLGEVSPAIAAGEGGQPSSSAAISTEINTNESETAAPSETQEAPSSEATLPAADETNAQSETEANTQETTPAESESASSESQPAESETADPAGTETESDPANETQPAESESAPAETETNAPEATPAESGEAETQPTETLPSESDPAEMDPSLLPVFPVPSKGIKGLKGGPLKAPAATNPFYTVTTWAGLVQQIQHAITNNINVADFRVDDNLVAESAITVPAGFEFNFYGNNGKAVTIYRHKDNTNFSVFTVENGATLSLSNGVTLSGDVAKRTVTTTTIQLPKERKGGGNYDSAAVVYNSRDPKHFYLRSGGRLSSIAGKSTAFAYVKVTDQNKIDERIDGQGTEYYVIIGLEGQYTVYNGGYLPKWALKGSGGSAEWQDLSAMSAAERYTLLTTDASYHWLEAPFDLQTGATGNKLCQYYTDSEGYGNVRFVTSNGSVGSWYWYEGGGTQTTTSVNWETSDTVYVKNVAQGKTNGSKKNAAGNTPSRLDQFTGENGKGFFVTVKGGGTFNMMDGATLQNFEAGQGNHKDNSPLGVAPVYSEGTVNMTGGTIKNNSVSYVVAEWKNNADYHATMTSYIDVFNNLNQISRQTGLYPEGAYSILDRVTNKRDQMSAGAIRAEGGTVNLSGGEILENKSHTGAIALGGSGTRLNMSGGIIDGNTGMLNGTVMVSGGTTMNMTGGSVGLRKGATRADGSYGTGNHNLFGGGIFIADNGTRNPNGTVNSGAGDKATFILNGVNAYISQNENRLQGGGISVYSNGVHLICGTINENIAHTMGGGMYVYGLDNPRGTEALVNYSVLIDYAGIHNNLATYSGRKNGNRESSVLDKYFYADYQRTSGGVTTSPSDTGSGADINRFTPGSGGGIWLCPQGAIEIKTQTVHIVYNDADVHGDDLFKDNGFGGGIVLAIDNDPAQHHDWFHDWALRNGRYTSITQQNENGHTRYFGEGEQRQYPINYYDFWMLNPNTNLTGYTTKRLLTPTELRTAVSNTARTGVAIGGSLGSANDLHSAVTDYNPRDVFQDGEGRLSDREMTYGYTGALALTNHYNREYYKFGASAACEDYKIMFHGDGSKAAPVQIYDNVARRGGGIGADGQLLFIDRNRDNDREISEAFVDFTKKFGAGSSEEKLRFTVFFEEDNYRIHDGKVQRKVVSTTGTGSSMTTSISWKDCDDLRIDGERIVAHNSTTGADESVFVILNDKVYSEYDSFNLFDKSWGTQNNNGYNGSVEEQSNVLILDQNNGDKLASEVAGNTDSNFNKARITIPVDYLRVRNVSTGLLESLFITDPNSANYGKIRAELFGSNNKLVSGYEWATTMLMKEYRLNADGTVGEEIKDNIFHLGELELTKKESRVQENTIQAPHPNGTLQADGTIALTEYTFRLTWNKLFFDLDAENSITPPEKYINGQVHADLASYEQPFRYSILALVPQDAEEFVITDTLEDPLMFVLGGQPQYAQSERFPVFKTSWGGYYVYVDGAQDRSAWPTWVKEQGGKKVSGYYYLGKAESGAEGGVEILETSGGNYVTAFNEAMPADSANPHNDTRNITQWGSWYMPVANSNFSPTLSNVKWAVFDENDHKGDGRGTAALIQRLEKSAGDVSKLLYCPANGIYYAKAGSNYFIYATNSSKNYAGQWYKTYLNGGSRSYEPVEGGTVLTEADSPFGVYSFDVGPNNVKNLLDSSGPAYTIESKSADLCYPIAASASPVVAKGSTADANGLPAVPAPQADGNTLYAKIGAADIEKFRGKWVQLSFDAAIKPHYALPGLLESRGFISDTESKKGLILPDCATDLNTYLEGRNASADPKDQAVIERIARKDGRYYARVQLADGSFEYYQKNESGDGRWYRSVAGPTYWNIPEGTVYNHSNPPKDRANAALAWHADVVSALSDANSLVTLYPATAETNWPVLDGTETHPAGSGDSAQPEQHAGTKNRADFGVKTSSGAYAYKTNIVTVEAHEPEKYVNSKVHDRIGNAGEFNAPFEYSIMAYVPHGAEELVIYDTLRPDLMFVDAKGNTQFKTFVVGADGSSASLNDDIPNPAFGFAVNGSGAVTKQEMVLNSAANPGGWQLIWVDSNNHIGDGVSGTVLQRKNNDNNFAQQHHIRINGNGSEPAVNFNGVSDGNVVIGNLTESGGEVTGITPNAEGNSIWVRLDRSLIEGKSLEGKWIILSFRAQIKPSKYDEVQKKLMKHQVLTTNKEEAYGYNAEMNPNPQAAGSTTMAAIHLELTEGLGTGVTVTDYMECKHYIVAKSSDNKYYQYIKTMAGVQAKGEEPAGTGNNGKSNIEKEDRALAVGRWLELGLDNGGTKFTDIYNTNASWRNISYDGISWTQQVIDGTQNHDLKENTAYASKTEAQRNSTTPINLYYAAGWDDEEPGLPSWELVTENDPILNPADTEKVTLKPQGGAEVTYDTGAHAGLANRAGVRLSTDGGSFTRNTNTVTVVPALRDVRIEKKWVVDENYQHYLDLSNEAALATFRNAFRLWWEYGSGEDKITGEITDLYQDHLKVVKSDIYQNGTYVWTLTWENLPVLEGQKYFITEKKLTGFDTPQYQNADTTEHAHADGRVLNVQTENPDKTHVSVNKTWNLGLSEDETAAERRKVFVEVKLYQNFPLLDSEGTVWSQSLPVFLRDNDNKLQLVEYTSLTAARAARNAWLEEYGVDTATGIYIDQHGRLFNGSASDRPASYNGETLTWHEFGIYYKDSAGTIHPAQANGAAPAGVTTDGKFYVPKLREDLLVSLNDITGWGHTWRDLPLYRMDENGQVIAVKDPTNGTHFKLGNALFESFMPKGVSRAVAPTADPATHNLVLNGTEWFKQDPDGTLTRGGVTYALSDKTNGTHWMGSDGGFYEVPAALINKYHLRADGVQPETDIYTPEYISYDVQLDGEYVFTIMETVPAAGEEYYRLGTDNLYYLQGDFPDGVSAEDEYFYSKDITGIYDTPKTMELVREYNEETGETYTAYAVKIENVKPRIEKYVNEDVHAQVQLTEEFTYSVLAYIPADAAGIQIKDKLLGTLVATGFKNVDHTQSYPGPLMYAEDITAQAAKASGGVPVYMAVHAGSNHRVKGTVANTEIIGTALGTLYLAADGTVTVEVEDILYWGDNLMEKAYIWDINGNYYVGTDNQIHHVIDLTTVPAKSQDRYSLAIHFDADGNRLPFAPEPGDQYYGVSDNGKYELLSSQNLSSGRKDKTVYRKNAAPANAQFIGGRYVELEIKAKFDEAKHEALAYQALNGFNTLTDRERIHWDTIYPDHNQDNIGFDVDFSVTDHPLPGEGIGDDGILGITKQPHSGVVNTASYDVFDHEGLMLHSTHSNTVTVEPLLGNLVVEKVNVLNEPVSFDLPNGGIDMTRVAKFYLVERGQNETTPITSLPADTGKIKYESVPLDYSAAQSVISPYEYDGSGGSARYLFVPYGTAETAMPDPIPAGTAPSYWYAKMGSLAYIKPGRYWLLETTAPENYLAGEQALAVDISYDENNKIAITFPQGSPYAAGNAGAAIDPLTGQTVTSATNTVFLDKDKLYNPASAQPETGRSRIWTITDTYSDGSNSTKNRYIYGQTGVVTDETYKIRDKEFILNYGLTQTQLNEYKAMLYYGFNGPGLSSSLSELDAQDTQYLLPPDCYLATQLAILMAVPGAAYDNPMPFLNELQMRYGDYVESSHVGETIAKLAFEIWERRNDPVPANYELDAFTRQFAEGSVGPNSSSGTEVLLSIRPAEKVDLDLRMQNLELENFEFGKEDENGRPIDHSDGYGLAEFELVQNSDGSTETLKDGAVAKYVSIPKGSGNLYTFVPASLPAAERTEAYAASHGILPGTYWLRETKAPANYKAGEPVKIIISYSESGELLITFPEGSPAAAGSAGAVVDPVSGKLIENAQLPEDYKNTFSDGRGLLQEAVSYEIVNGGRTALVYRLVGVGVPKDSNYKAEYGITPSRLKSLYQGPHGLPLLTDAAAPSLVRQLKSVLYYGFGQEGFKENMAEWDAISGFSALTDSDWYWATQMAILSLTYDYLEPHYGMPASFDDYAALLLQGNPGDNIPPLVDAAEVPAVTALYKAIAAKKNETISAAALDIFAPQSDGLASTGDATDLQAVSLRMASFAIQNETDGVPLKIRKVDGDDNDNPISYHQDLQVWRNSNGGTHVEYAGKYYWIGKENEHYKIESGQIVILKNPDNYDPLESRLASGKDRSNTAAASHHDGTGNRGSLLSGVTYRYIDQNKTASFALIPVRQEFEVVRNAGGDLYAKVPRGEEFEGITPIGWDQSTDSAYFWLGNNPQSLRHTESGKTLWAPADFAQVEQHYVPTYTQSPFRPAGELQLMGYYWGKTISADMVTPAASQAMAMAYLSQADEAKMRQDGVYVTAPESENGENAVYRFRKAAAPAGSADPEDWNIPEGTYWLVETDKPEGYFSGAKPVRVAISKQKDAGGNLIAKVEYAGDTESSSPEKRAWEQFVTYGKTGNSLLGFAANGNLADMGYRNYQLYEMPSSGGPGTYLFTVLGTMFLALAAGYGWQLKKRRRQHA